MGEPIEKKIKETGNGEMQKECSACHAIKSIESFSSNRTSPDGYHWRCKDCQAASNREYRERQKRGERIIGLDPIVRFWSKVNKTDGCWEWNGTLNQWGYGVFVVNHESILAHRFSYELHHGPIPDGLLVCHHCDNPKCIRDEHLFLGTDRDNTADMIAKGRKSHASVNNGDANGSAKLTVEDVVLIRQQKAKGVRTRVLAEQFNISDSNVEFIVARKTWRCIE